MIDPASNASPQIQQSVTNPVQKRTEDQQQQQQRQVRNDDQQSGNQVQKTGNNEGFKSELVQVSSNSTEDTQSRNASQSRGSLLDITV